MVALGRSHSANDTARGADWDRRAETRPAWAEGPEQRARERKRGRSPTASRVVQSGKRPENHLASNREPATQRTAGVPSEFPEPGSPRSRAAVGSGSSDKGLEPPEDPDEQRRRRTERGGPGSAPAAVTARGRPRGGREHRGPAAPSAERTPAAAVFGGVCEADLAFHSGRQMHHGYPDKSEICRND